MQHQTLKFYIELKDFKPRTWRRITVPGSCTLAELAYIIISAFNGMGSHLYEFSIKGQNYGCIFEDDDLSNLDYALGDATKYRAGTTISKTGMHCTFMYDFGDSWEFDVKLEKVLDASSEAPQILSGENYGIIEDCGGTQGLERLIKVFQSKKGDEYNELSEWLGTENFDFSEFDIDGLNSNLKYDLVRLKEAYEE